MISWIFKWIFLNFFDSSLFLWYNSFLPVKYRTKPIKCLEMRAKTKVFLYIFENFLCKLRFTKFQNMRQFWWKMFFWLFSKPKIQMSNPKSKYKEGIWWKFIYHANRLINIFSKYLNFDTFFCFVILKAKYQNVQPHGQIWRSNWVKFHL